MKKEAKKTAKGQKTFPRQMNNKAKKQKATTGGKGRCSTLQIHREARD